MNAATFDAMRRTARASYVRRPHDKALIATVRRLGAATTGQVLNEYYATPLERHVGERMATMYLKRLREEGKLNGAWVSRGARGATTIYTVGSA